MPAYEGLSSTGLQIDSLLIADPHTMMSNKYLWIRDSQTQGVLQWHVPRFLDHVGLILNRHIKFNAVVTFEDN